MHAPPAPGPDAADDRPAALLLAALVEVARRDAHKGDARARRWLQEYVEAPAAALVARGRVRLAA